MEEFSYYLLAKIYIFWAAITCSFEKSTTNHCEPRRRGKKDRLYLILARNPENDVALERVGGR